MKRTDIINAFIQKYGYKSYLEVGTQDPASNFDLIEIEHKISIDPFPIGEVTFIGTSDEYFESITDNIKYDIIFIDGLHHSDQVLKDIENSLNHLSENPDILYSDANFVDLKGHFMGKRSEATPHKLPQNLTWKDFKFGMLICHQAFVCKKSIAPYFSLEYQLSSDIDWEIECLKAAHKINYMHEPICNYLMGGASVKNLRKSWLERFQVLSRHYGLLQTIMNHLIIIFRGILFAYKKGEKYW